MTVNKMIRDLNFYRGQKLFEFNGKKPEIYIFDIIDIINHQKAEIEKLWICVDELKKEVSRHERNYDPADETQKIIKKIMGKDGTKKVRGKIKAEAYKEFAERVHCHCESIINQEWNKMVAPVSWADAYEQFDNEVDNLLEELKGENNEKTKKND